MIYNYRSFLLETFGIEREYAAVFCSEIRLKNRLSHEPFGEIYTKKNGKTVLRVGGTQTDGPVLTVS